MQHAEEGYGYLYCKYKIVSVISDLKIEGTVK